MRQISVWLSLFYKEKIHGSMVGKNSLRTAHNVLFASQYILIFDKDKIIFLVKIRVKIKRST